MKTLLFFLVLLGVYWLWDMIGFRSDEAAERMEKDEKYSYKKMNAEINKNKKMDNKSE